MKKDPMLDESGNPIINPATKQPFPGTGAARKAWVFELDGKEVMEVPDKFATVWGNMRTAEAFRKKTYEGEGGLEDLRRKSAAADAAAASQSQQTQQAAPEPVPTDLKARLEYRKQQQREKYKGRAGAPVQASSTVTGFDESAFKAEITEPRVASALTALNERAAAANPILRGQNPVVQAVALVESSGRANAVSPKGATGLMQIMPGTFKDVVKKYKLPEMDPYNVADNLKVGSIYLAEQIKRFGAAPGQGLELALAAYNTGPGRVADALRNAEVKSWEGVKAELKKVLNDKAYAEVSSYPDKVLRNMLG
jgi:soluble lytic murein transglycosylase-like protein